jgi:HlyD family secretion protein
MRKAFLASAIVLLLACHSKEKTFDASGSFEVDEVIVSSQLNGQLLTLNVQEGDSLHQGQVVGTIDSDYIALQKKQVEASIHSLTE